MYLWEMLAFRLRADGWTVWHRACQDGGDLAYVVHAQRGATTCRASAPTLTEAFAEAARRARERPHATPGPHFAAATAAAR